MCLRATLSIWGRQTATMRELTSVVEGGQSDTVVEVELVAGLVDTGSKMWCGVSTEAVRLVIVVERVADVVTEWRTLHWPRPLYTHTHTHTLSLSVCLCHTVFVRRPNPISQTQSVQLVLLQPSVKFEVSTLSYPNFGGSPNLSRNSAISDKPRDVCASILQFL